MSFEESVAWIPIFVVALAVTFDVGYFWAIDINMFTLFSLSEHLVFAAQAIPIVLFVSVFGVLLVAISSWMLTSNGNKESTSRSVGRKFKWLSIFWYSYMTIAIIVTYLLGLWTYLYFNSFILFIGIVFDLLPRSFIVHVFAHARLSFGIACAVVLFSLVLAAGHSMAANYIADYKNFRHVVQLKNQSEVSGRIVRSGDRGVLMVDAEGGIRFIRMDGVVMITKRR
jgi:hypothetical protein